MIFHIIKFNFKQRYKKNVLHNARRFVVNVKLNSETNLVEKVYKEIQYCKYMIFYIKSKSFSKSDGASHPVSVIKNLVDF